MSIPASIRPDLARIAAWIEPGSRVLDLGCGDGTLLAHLRDTRQVIGYGVEIDINNIAICVEKGVNVIQSNLDTGMVSIEPGSFDYVILSLTLQSMHNVEGVIAEMLRVGRQGIVTFPNFGYWENRWQIFLGHMPVSETIPYEWYNTPNIHLCTCTDFELFCARHGARILEREVMHGDESVTFLPNLLGSLAIYRFERG